MPSRARPKSNPGLRSAAFLIWGGAACLAGFFAYARFGPGNRVPADEIKKIDVSSPAARPDSATAPVETPNAPDEVTVNTPVDNNGTLSFKGEKVKVPAGANRYAAAVDGFLSRAKIAPSGSKVVSAVVDDRGILTLSFSKQFDTTYGTEDERTIVEGILEAVRQFKEVASVRFQVLGKPLETLGSIDLTEDQPVR